jgi:putative ABC transport system permease protein
VNETLYEHAGGDDGLTDPLGRRPAAAIAIGAIAGLLPAIRAARMSPTEALRTT